MTSEKYDAIVIGTGQSGPSLAARLAKEGMRTAIIERKQFGGTCVNVGCIPTKTLVASARAAHVARRAADFGVVIDSPIEVDMKRVKARKDAVVRQSNEGVTNWLKNMDNLHVYEGHGRFETEHTVRVDDNLLEADRIFVDVGARASIPDMPGLQEVDYLTNSSMMEVDFLPEHLIVVGGSYIGLEFGQMYRRFGSRVTVIQRADRLIPRDDEDVSAAVKEILTNEGIEVRTSAECASVAKRGDSVAVNFSCNGGQDEIVGSHLLLAVGRQPNTDDLGLDKAGIETNSRGFIVVDDQLRTNVPHIWATGDVNGRGAFTHTSYNDYEIVAANLFDNDPRRVAHRPCPRAKRDAGIHESPDRRRDKEDLGSRYSRNRRRRDRSLDPRRNVRRCHVHGNSACRAHPSNGHGADPHDARRSAAPGVIKLSMAVVPRSCALYS